MIVFVQDAIAQFHKLDEEDILIAIPSKESVLGTLNNHHPRLRVNDTRLEEIRSIAAQHPEVAEWIELAREKTDHMLGEAANTYKRPLLEISRSVLDRVYHLAFFYRYDNDNKYLDRAVEELEAAASFVDWNLGNFLSVSEMMHAFGIGYDWLYHGLTDAERTTIREALWDKGLSYSYAGYNNVTVEGMDRTWPYKTHNWNFVCNGGSAIGAMAIMDEMPDECSFMLRGAFGYTQILLPTFDPDGAYPEGLGYWDYAMRYITPMLQSMESAFGTDFGYTEALKEHGFSKTGDFPVYLTSPFGPYFSFADSKYWLNFKSPSLFYLSQKFNKPLQHYFQRSVAEHTLFDVINYKPLNSDVKLEDLPLDKHFKGKVEIATMRSSWTDPNATFVCFKSGFNGFNNHAHYDLGSFIFYDRGVKWFFDLGRDRAAYGNRKGFNREDFYMQRTEGHNALVINPSISPGQAKEGASAFISKISSSPSESLLVADLGGAYKNYPDGEYYVPDQVAKYQRGVRFFDHRRKILIRDEIEALEDSEMYWFAHTPAEIELLNEGKKARLTYEDKVLYAHLQSPAEATFSSVPAAPLSTSKQIDFQNDYSWINKLTVHIENMQKGVIEIVMIPAYEFEEEPTVDISSKLIEEWELDESNRPLLSEISLDGKLLSGFTENVFTYSVVIPSGTEIFRFPSIAAKGEGTVEITRASGVPGVTTITTTEDGQKSEYRIYFVQEDAQSDLRIVTHGFLESMIADGVPEFLRGPEQDADGDGIQNLIEFVNRTNANGPASFSNPKISIYENVEGDCYLEARFQVDPKIDTYHSDIQFSLSPSFQALLDAELVSEVDVGDGLLVERTYRSSAPIEAAPQFARLTVSGGVP